MPPDSKIVFVIRIKGINRIPPTAKKILRLLRLRQIYNGVFVKVNKATLNMLQRVHPYVTFGYPTRETISKLIYTRGAGRIGRSRIPLIDNRIIDEHLGRYDIICIEDLIEHIYQCDENFKEANSFLWPFKLHSPRGGWKSKKRAYQEGGDCGNREGFINNLIKKML